MTFILWRIPITLHYSWFIAFGLITWALSGQFLQHTDLHFPWHGHWAAAAGATLLILGSVFLHEAAHAGYARYAGYTVTGIHLHLLGGWTTCSTEFRTPSTSARAAAAGPACSFLLAFFCWCFRDLVLFDYLYRVNLALGAYNIGIPCLPLDAGRIVHAYYWSQSGSFAQAWERCAKLSKHLSLGMMCVAVVAMAMGHNALWLFFVAIILRLLADRLHKPVIHSASLTQSVASLMIPLEETIHLRPDDTFHTLQQRFLQHGHRAYPILFGDIVTGYLRYQDVRQDPGWLSTPQESIHRYIIPLAPEHTIEQHEPLWKALDAMILKQDDSLIVCEQGQPRGWLSRPAITRTQDQLAQPTAGPTPPAITQPIWE